MSTSSPRRRWARAMAMVLLLFVAGAVMTVTWLTRSFDASVSTLPYAVVGTAIVWQRPRTSIGWVLLVFAGLWAATFLGLQLVSVAGTEAMALFAAWLSEWTWFPALVSVFVVLPILFPTGRPAGPGWAAVLGVAVGTCVAFIAATTVQARFNPHPTLALDNPWGILAIPDVEAWLLPAAMPLLLLGPTAAVVRYRRSTGVERQQIRWFMYAAVSCGVIFLVNALVDSAIGGTVNVVTEVALAAALSLPPLGVWVAVTRYRLYDIDRLISRTVSYGLLTAFLIGLYVLSVFVLGTVIPVEGDLPVAASTLVVAAAFNPGRRRIQEVVDRHFNRARYNALRLAENFSHRLRLEQDLEGIDADLREAVITTMQPSSYALWLADVRPGD